MSQLPYNVLAHIASKADSHTKARMRVMNRTTYADPRLRGPRGVGYLYGTGELQKLYNDMPRRLKNSTRRPDLSFSERSTLQNLEDDFKIVRDRYANAVKTRAQIPEEFRKTDPAIARTSVGYSYVLGRQRPDMPAEPEAFMTTYLKILDYNIRWVMRGRAAQPVTAANRAARKNTLRAVHRGLHFRGGAPARHSRHLARRAARRLAQQQPRTMSRSSRVAAVADAIDEIAQRHRLR